MKEYRLIKRGRRLLPWRRAPPRCHQPGGVEGLQRQGGDFYGGATDGVLHQRRR
jgi:hypothetical protein